MTLFDNRPLTEAEVRARDLCECGDSRAKHGVSGAMARARHEQYHRRYHGDCYDRCPFDPLYACANPECRCVRFRRARK